ncbi:N-acetyltransferase [Sphingobacteriales bacterium UPWRP_1]|nr:GNAT family N-acetyltransferase [Sphingobacteriales bacterium TSM_CSS]PSJ73021.1 N-acetyltransferase [Sphingobacteriales bacterium UPWRP_1]
MKPATFTISPALAQHLAKLQYISRRTFTEAFAHENSPQNMQQYKQTALSRKQLDMELSNPQSAFYLALCKGSAVGYLKLNWGNAQTEFFSPNQMEIERIYVLKSFYGTGLAPALLQTAINAAKQQNADCIWLGVWEKNSRAIGFYQKNGFVVFGSHSFTLGQDVQQDILMKLELTGSNTI